MDAAKSTDDMNAVGDAVLKALQDAIAEQTYGDPVSGQIHIVYNKDAKQGSLAAKAAMVAKYNEKHNK